MSGRALVAQQKTKVEAKKMIDLLSTGFDRHILRSKRNEDC